MGQFYYAAKAFDALEKLDPGSNYWEGKRGACVGVFQLILANKESRYVSFGCIRLSASPAAGSVTESSHYMIKRQKIVLFLIRKIDIVFIFSCAFVL